MSSTISEVTRRNLFDELKLAQINWSGRLPEDEFLLRIFDLSALPSHDPRRKDMAGDLRMHRFNFPDWDDDWVYDDLRLNLLRCADDILLNFLCEMLHPLVRADENERERLLAIVNTHLAVDGYEVAPHRYISGKPIYAGRLRYGIEDMPSSARKIADALRSTHVAAQVTRMQTSVQRDPPLAIGTAKEFVETICKGILSDRGVFISGNEDLPRLVRQTREVLAIDDGDGDGAIRKVINGLATVTQGVAELRSRHGTGHGPHPNAEMAGPELARLTVGACVALGVFLLEVHQRTIPTKTPSHVTR